jgi:hypothetical protein
VQCGPIIRQPLFDLRNTALHDIRQKVFAGECSYLLFSDFFNHILSVVVNYEGSSRKITRKSMTIVSDAKQIDVDSNFRVVVSGRKIEMPFVYNKTSIVRDGQRIIINNNGYRDICPVHITG